MIEGIKIELSSKELRDHLLERVSYHDGKRAFYEGQVASLRAGGVNEQAVSNDPVSSLEMSARRHSERADFFSFMADHLIDETYRLSESDLTRIEIIGKAL